MEVFSMHVPNLKTSEKNSIIIYKNSMKCHMKNLIKIPVKTTYLEMHTRPQHIVTATPENVNIEEWNYPTASEYLEIYRKVGSPWGWTGRLLLSETELNAELKSAHNKIFRIFHQNHFAGFIEFSQWDTSEPEILYFGLLQAFTGKGIGGFFLKWGIMKAWNNPITKLWLHTCEYDHPNALNVYQKVGFEIKEVQTSYEYYDDAFLEEWKKQHS
ncbi:GNAT family N-acetyltransferase [Limibacter armeniacum]|uniref:GNAT family N-acetyltransferase n=1 Tax=Limibacter armeniacum TaxID=466084 RepID=UPI002FE65B68